MEHRTVMENFIGRKLTRYEHIHHLNGNKLDNKIENLAILSPEIHQKTHVKMFNSWRLMYENRIRNLEFIVSKNNFS